MKETLDNKLEDIRTNLESQLKDNFKDASKIFDNNIKTLIKELYSETVYPKLEQELNDISFQIVEKVEEIENALDKKLETKAEKTLVEGVSKELSAIQKANIELNDNINKGVNKALSRAGNVKTLVEKIATDLDKKIDDKAEKTLVESLMIDLDEKIDNKAEMASIEKINKRLDSKAEKRSVEKIISDFEDKFDTKAEKTLVEKLNKKLETKAEKTLVEKIETTLVKKIANKADGDVVESLRTTLETKAEKALVEDVTKELFALQKSNIELNDNINSGVEDAIRHAGEVKTLVEKIDKEINDKISTELENIENYFDERIQNIQEKTFDITEESRKYIIDLVNKSKIDLLEEIRKIPTEKPIEYIIESKSKDPEKVNLDKLKKEYDTIIHNKFENYKTDLRKYIAVYSGGGSVAVQFADGGTMNGDLGINGNLRARNTTFNSITADNIYSTQLDVLSANIKVINITQYELSGFHVEGDVQITGNLAIVGGVSANNIDTPILHFDTAYSKTGSEPEGSIYWNSTDKTVDLVHDGAIQQIGQELFIRVRNVTGSTIENGTPVYINGRSGNRPRVYPAMSNSHSTSKVAGITTEDIPNNSDGFITTFGYVRQIKTNYTGIGNWGTTWAEGDNLYVSKDIPGQLTNIEPPVPHHSDIIGNVGIVGSAGIGSIFVSIYHHKSLEELCDVNGTPLTTTGQVPTWNVSLSAFDFNHNVTDYLYTWSHLSSNWSEEPALISSLPSGQVYSYTLNNVTRYRYVPATYDPKQDAFYSTFAGGILSGLITTRG